MYQAIIQTFQSHQNKEQQEAMKAYMRNRFDFFGIKSPLRAEISKPFFLEIKSHSKKATFDLIKKLWNQPQRELHYLAQELFFKVAKKHLDQKEDVDFLQWLIVTDSWWDTVDFVAPKLMKIYFDKFSEVRNSKVDEWVSSNNIWLQRSAILIHLKQKKQLDAPYLFDTILRLNNTREFFVDKAIGWALRENIKHHEKEVLAFVLQNKGRLSSLSYKEALKHHPNLI